MCFFRRVAAFTRGLCLLCVAFWTLGGPAFAATVTWDGSTDGTWATGANWVGDAAPAAADTAAFSDGGSGNTTIDLGGAQTINHLRFDNAATAAYTIGVTGTDTLALQNGGGIDLTAANANDQLVDADITLGDGNANTINFDNDSINTLTIAGDIDTGTGGGTPGIQILQISGTGLVDISGGISETGPATRSKSKVSVAICRSVARQIRPATFGTEFVTTGRSRWPRRVTWAVTTSMFGMEH